MNSAIHAIPQAALAVLGLPRRETLPDAQQRGAVCVWCPQPLTGESAIDLGEQSDEAGERWFPRACLACLTTRAHAGLFAHAEDGEGCTHDAEECTIGRALFRLWREAQR